MCDIFQTILEVVLPRYLDHLKRETNQRDNPPAARAEISTISDIGTSLKAMLTSCEFFTRLGVQSGFLCFEFYKHIMS